ncbi:MAG: M48 family metalloprotease [Bacteroidota bacterium]
MKRLFNVLCLSVFSYVGNAQDFSINFIPVDTSRAMEKELLVKKLERRFQGKQAILRKTKKGKLRAALLDIHEKKHQELIQEINNNAYHLNNAYTQYSEQLLAQLKENNPGLIPKDLMLLVSKSPHLNAYDTGDGIIILNMGTFSSLENEEQLKSILGHETAHALLNHVRDNMEGFINTYLSKESKKEVRDIYRSRFNRNSQGVAFSKKRLYQNSSIRRLHEFEADSLGLLIFQKATEYPQESYYSIQGLKEHEEERQELDQELEIKKATYTRYFNLPSLPFDHQWMALEDFSSYTYDNYTQKFDVDSLKTHPDLQVRMERLQRMLGSAFDPEKPPKGPSPEFVHLKENALLQHVADLYDLKRHGYSIFITLHLLQKHPENPYLLRYLGHNFTKLYEAKKQYRFNRYVPKLIPNKQTANTVQFLNFLWNLELEDFQKIGTYYTNGSKRP